MKISILFATVLASLCLFSTLTFAQEQNLDPYKGLYKASCSAHEDVNDDPVLAITFSKDDYEHDRVKVRIEERMSSRIFKDFIWVNIYEQAEQVSIGNTSFSMGIDDVEIFLKRSEPLNEMGMTGYVEFRIGRSQKKYELSCFQIN